MQKIAKKYNRHYFSAFGLHIFSNIYNNLPKNLIKICLRIPQLGRILLPSKKSLIPEDYYKLTGKKIGSS